MQQGIVIPVIEYAAYNHSFLSTGAIEEIVLADRIPVAPMTQIGLSLRIHKRNIVAGASYQIIVRGINPSDRDGADFVWATDLGSTAATTGTTNPTTVPGVMQLTTIITNVQQPMIRVVLKATGPSSAGNFYIVISGDLVMRTG